MNHPAEHLIDIAAVTGLLAVLLGILPHATAVLTFIWVCVRLYETATVRLLLERVRKWCYG